MIFGVVAFTIMVVTSLLFILRKIRRRKPKPLSKAMWIFPLIMIPLFFAVATLGSVETILSAFTQASMSETNTELLIDAIKPQEVEITNQPKQESIQVKTESGKNFDCGIPGGWVKTIDIAECVQIQEAYRASMKNSSVPNNQTAGSYSCTTYYGYYLVPSSEYCDQLKAHAEILKSQGQSAQDAIKKLDEIGNRTFNATPVTVNIPTQTPFNISYPPKPTCTLVGNSDVTICNP